MASIFEPPAWLQRRAESGFEQASKAAGDMGTLIGTGLAAGVKWATDNPDTEDPLTGTTGKQSFWTKYQEARLNQENPLWALKAQQERQSWLTAGVALREKTAQLTESSDELVKWNDDAPGMAKWTAMTPDQRKAESEAGRGFTPKSVKGITGMQKQSQIDEQHFSRQAQMKSQEAARRFAVENSAENVKQKNEWTNAYRAVNGPERIALNKLPNRGMGQDGLPTGDAMDIIERWREAKGMPAVGEKPTPGATGKSSGKSGQATVAAAPHAAISVAPSGSTDATPKPMVGTVDNPAKPMTQQDFDDLPVGALFINPRDGKLMRVK